MVDAVLRLGQWEDDWTRPRAFLFEYPSPFSYPHDIAMNIVGRAESRSQLRSLTI